jgi:hypothetical protein
MKAKLTTILLTALLLMASVSSLVAQDKYEYAIVSLFDITRLAITKHTTEYLAYPKGSDIASELIKKVEEMSKEGWEVHNTVASFTEHGFVNGHIYYLRRKLKD